MDPGSLTPSSDLAPRAAAAAVSPSDAPVPAEPGPVEPVASWRGVFLDTHAAVFLWTGRVEQFGPRSRHLLERAELRVSPVVRLELGFLHEVGRITVDADTLLGGLAADLGVTASEEPLAAVVGRALGLAWTRDPFDRLLVATAALHDAPLVTKDRAIREHYPAAVW